MCDGNCSGCKCNKSIDEQILKKIDRLINSYETSNGENICDALFWIREDYYTEVDSDGKLVRKTNN